MEGPDIRSGTATLPGRCPRGRPRTRDMHREHFFEPEGAPLVRLCRVLAGLRRTHASLRSRTSFYDNQQSRLADWGSRLRALGAGRGGHRLPQRCVRRHNSCLPVAAAGTCRERIDDGRSAHGRRVSTRGHAGPRRRTPPSDRTVKLWPRLRHVVGPRHDGCSGGHEGDTRCAARRAAWRGGLLSRRSSVPRPAACRTRTRSPVAGPTPSATRSRRRTNRRSRSPGWGSQPCTIRPSCPASTVPPTSPSAAAPRPTHCPSVLPRSLSYPSRSTASRSSSTAAAFCSRYAARGAVNLAMLNTGRPGGGVDGRSACAPFYAPPSQSRKASLDT